MLNYQRVTQPYFHGLNPTHPYFGQFGDGKNASCCFFLSYCKKNSVVGLNTLSGKNTQKTLDDLLHGNSEHKIWIEKNRLILIILKPFKNTFSTRFSTILNYMKPSIVMAFSQWMVSITAPSRPWQRATASDSPWHRHCSTPRKQHFPAAKAWQTGQGCGCGAEKFHEKMGVPSGKLT